MMQKHIIKQMFSLLLLLQLVSCKYEVKNSIEGSNIDYRYKGFREMIRSFIKNNAQRSDSIIGVDLKKSNDSIIVSIANVFPKLSNTKFVGSDTVAGKKIYFIGDTSRYLYFPTFEQQTPEVLTLLNERLRDSTKPPLSVDPQLWIFYFKGTTLIGSIPPYQ